MTKIILSDKKLLLMLSFLLVINPYSCAEDSYQFLCDIRVSPESLVIYEPLRIDIKVQYMGDIPIRALLPTGAHSLIILELVNKSQQYHQKLNIYQLYTNAPTHITPFPTQVIPARASSLFSIECFYDWYRNEFLFHSPGVYEVIVQCLIPVEEGGDVRIKEAKAKSVITVRDYQGDDLNLWKLSSIHTILSGQTIQDRQLRNLSTLITQYPKSPYRPYALAILGGIFGGVPKEITTQQQITYLEQVVSEYPNFPWMDYVAAMLCKTYSDMGQVHKAKAMADFILRNPWTPYALKGIIKRLMEKLINQK